MVLELGYVGLVVDAPVKKVLSKEGPRMPTPTSRPAHELHRGIRLRQSGERDEDADPT